MDVFESGDTEVFQNQDVVGCCSLFLQTLLEKQPEWVVVIYNLTPKEHLSETQSSEEESGCSCAETRLGLMVSEKPETLQFYHACTYFHLSDVLL